MTQAQALQILKTGANVFLTGEPGSGKSHTTRAYIEYLRSHAIEPAITASTGIAATHIHGMTIHSWSGLGIKQTVSPYDLELLEQKEYVVKRIRQTTTLIIDEISMVSGTLLETINTVCKSIRRSGAPFGGMQVVVVGDFFQLPPISQGSSSAIDFAFQSSVWKEAKFIPCYLSEQHRQDDRLLEELLYAIRTNTITKEHKTFLRSQCIEEITEDYHQVTKLFTKNITVDSLNSDALRAIDQELFTYRMETKGKDVLVASLMKGCLSPEVLELKKGSIVMCTKNNQKAGFVNGTLGTVVGFQPYTRYPIIDTVNGKTITIEPMEWAIEENGKIKASIVQIPLRLAWAITIHKSQGMSLDGALIDLSDVFEYGQGYVALSRVRSRSHLYLLGFNDRALEVHPEVLTYDTLFREKSHEAVEYVSTVEEIKLTHMHEAFIKASGGSLKKQKVVEKMSTVDETLALLRDGLSLKQIAKKRDLVMGTIIEHLEKARDTNRVALEDIRGACDKKFLKTLPTIIAAFKKKDTEKLAPIAEELKYKYSFEELRLARILKDI